MAGPHDRIAWQRRVAASRGSVAWQDRVAGSCRRIASQRHVARHVAVLRGRIVWQRCMTDHVAVAWQSRGSAMWQDPVSVSVSVFLLTVSVRVNVGFSCMLVCHSYHLACRVTNRLAVYIDGMSRDSAECDGTPACMYCALNTILMS